MPAGVGGWRVGGGVGALRVSLRSVMIGSCIGQETMNIWARLKAKVAVEAVSNAVGNGDAPTPAQKYESWRDSTVKMLLAAVSSMGSSVSRAPPPR